MAMIEAGGEVLMLKRASAYVRPLSDDDFDVLCKGAVVGRIFHAKAAPVGSPWMWTMIFPHDCGDWPPSASEAPKFTQAAEPSPIWGLSILPSKPKNEGSQTNYEKLSKSEKQENHQFGVMHELPPFVRGRHRKRKLVLKCDGNSNKIDRCKNVTV
jgi:hypothetical protein